MSAYLAKENIRRFRALLDQELEPARRRTIEALLAEEEAKLAGMEPGPAPSPRDGHEPPEAR